MMYNCVQLPKRMYIGTPIQLNRCLEKTFGLGLRLKRTYNTTVNEMNITTINTRKTKNRLSKS